jgi:hypothetical protein
MSCGRSVGGATVAGAGGSVPGAVARVSRPGRTVPGAGAMVPGAGTMVRGAWVVPFVAESFHTLGQFVKPSQKFCLVCWLDNAGERGPRN